MELIVLKNNKPFTTSLIISEGVGIEHRAVISLLRKHSNTKTLSTFVMSKLSTKGRPVEIAFLSEIQAAFLITLMNNSEKVIDFKEKLTQAFFQQREILYKLLSQKNNAEWQLERQSGKLIRKECTEIIKEFIEYAVKQGSKNAMRYYSNISKMEINSLFLIEQKFPNMREALNIRQLNLLKCADEAVQQSLIDGMADNLHYKEIYQLAKNKIEAIAKIFPPSPLPSLLGIENEKS